MHSWTEYRRDDWILFFCMSSKKQTKATQFLFTSWDEMWRVFWRHFQRTLARALHKVYGKHLQIPFILVKTWEMFLLFGEKNPWKRGYCLMPAILMPFKSQHGSPQHSQRINPSQANINTPPHPPPLLRVVPKIKSALWQMTPHIPELQYRCLSPRRGERNVAEVADYAQPEV